MRNVPNWVLVSYPTPPPPEVGRTSGRASRQAAAIRLGGNAWPAGSEWGEGRNSSNETTHPVAKKHKNNHRNKNKNAFDWSAQKKTTRKATMLR